MGWLLKVACVIPTFNGRADLLRLLRSLKMQSALFDLLVVDSGSTDGTEELAREYVRCVISISSRQFNHGGTRQMMVDSYPDYDVYVFLTQDAYLEDPCAIEKLLAHFDEPKVGAVCGRQLPHRDASALAAHSRFFNYPATSRVKSINDSSEFGIKTPFISNSFSAYRRDALVATGGFPAHVILSEDMYVAAKMLIAGWCVAYAGDAVCRHSHNYTAKEEFCRYFDQGVFHAREPWIRQRFGGAGGEGLRYVISELRYLGFFRSYLWPSSVLRNALKLLAYKLGQRERYLPKLLKKKLSMHWRYWESL
ncbi:glycosyltransferase [Ectopseudomonas mendocina]|jgi:rhamnosyltransferase|uniref:glycosyltransferase n=1 Tax=Ectopseudomonas mendocina TaxID=300 RepID=UPI003132ADB1